MSTITTGTQGKEDSLTSIARITIHRVQADGVTVFYREAGPADAPVLLLLHGFPTSSLQFRELMPRLAGPYRVIAPDLPGFGFTEAAEHRQYQYSFDALAHTMLAFTDSLGLERFALYVFDYGAPTGFRLALARPERVTAIISQNGNAYEEGLGDAWAPIRRYWSEPSAENRAALRQALTPEGIRREYSLGIPKPGQPRWAIRAGDGPDGDRHGIPSRGSMASTRRGTRSARCARRSICSAGAGDGPQPKCKDNRVRIHPCLRGFPCRATIRVL